MQLPANQEALTTFCALCGAQNQLGVRVCAACAAPLAPPANAHADALPGGKALQNGQYVLASVLGQGGFGITYRGHDAGLNRAVAIKEFFPAGCNRSGDAVRPAQTQELEAYRNAKQRFIEEARTIARFRHPGIVEVYAVFEENDAAYMVMELLTGKTLLQLIEARGALPEAEAVAFIAKAGEALAVVHENGLLHRDLKPANMMLRDDGNLVLIDFGTAREFAPDTTRRMTTTVTPGYAPLEQYGQQARFGAFTDVYALGATLYHMVTGEPPVQAPDRASGVELTEPATLKPALSSTLSKAILWALEVNIKDRPQSVREFLDSLTAGRIGPRTQGHAERATTTAKPRGFAESVAPAKLEVDAPTAAERLAQIQSKYDAEIDRAKSSSPDAKGDKSLGNAIALIGFIVLFFVVLFIISNESSTKNDHSYIKTPQGVREFNPPPHFFDNLTTAVETPKLAYITDRIGLAQPGSASFSNLTLSPDGTQVIGISERDAPEWITAKIGQGLLSTVVSWNTRNGQLKSTRLTAKAESHGLNFSPDGDWIAGMHHGFGKTKTSALFLVNARSGERIWSRPRLNGQIWSCRPGVALSKESGNSRQPSPLVACVYRNSKLGGAGQVALYDVGGKLIEGFRSQRPVVGDENLARVALSPDGSLLVAKTDNSGIQVWETSSKKPTVTGSVSSSILGMAFSFDNKLLAVFDGDGVVTIWNTQKGKIERMIRQAQTNPTAIAFATASNTLAVGRAKQVDIYDISDRKYLKSRLIKNGNIDELRFVDDDNKLVLLTGEPDGVYIWKLE